MRKFTIALAGAAAMLGAGTANATQFINPIDDNILRAANSDTFGVTFDNEAGAFTSIFTFSLLSSALANSTVTSIQLAANDIDIASIFLNGFAFTQTSFDPMAENFQLSTVGLNAGTHTITVRGTVLNPSGDASFAGTLNVTPTVAGAIPEPGTWAMMLFGFGAAGVAMRRRKRPLGAMQIA